jgi:hypothetical protein
MKKLISVLVLMLLYVNIFAQEVKPCLFIGMYDEQKRGICSDRAMVQEGVKDYAEYKQKSEQFNEAHKTQNPNTRFFTEKEAVIAYKYEKKIVGWNCNSKVVGIKTGKNIEDCNKLLADQLSKYPKDFTSQPNTFFSWQGKGSRGNEYVKDYGGLQGRFLTANTSTKKVIVAQLTNKTTNKLATVLLRSADGKMMVEYIYPRSVFTKKYDTEKLEVQVLYQDYKVPKPTTTVIEFIKDKTWEIMEEENGMLKIKKWDPTCMCVRG